MWHRNSLGAVLHSSMLSTTGTVSGGLACAKLQRYHSSANIKTARNLRLRERGTEITCDRSRSEDVILLERPGSRRRQQEAARDSIASALSQKWQEAEHNDMSQHNKVRRS